MHIGLLIIATNKYVEFVPNLVNSAQKYFLPNHNVVPFVFTDKELSHKGVIRVEHEHSSWPMPTLKRYHCFTKHAKMLSNMDYLYYCDADMLFESEVGDEVLGDSVAVLHPGFYNADEAKRYSSYDINPNSTAYMRPGLGKRYYAGGFNGGKAENFLAMSETLMQCIDTDTQNKVMAKWHDESHLNRYFAINTPSVVLSPAYCYNPLQSLPFPRKLIALPKNHAEYRA